MSEVDQVDDLNAEITAQVQVNEPAVEMPVSTPEPKPDTSNTTDPTGLRATLRKAMAETAAKQAEKVTAPIEKPAGEETRQRGPDGKFLPKDAAPIKPVEQPKVDVKPSEGAQPGAEQAKKPDAAPGTWRAEAKAKWDGLDPVVKAEVLKTQSEASREIGKFQQQIQQINQAYGPIEQVIGPHRNRMRVEAGSEAEYLKRTLEVSEFASKDPTQFLGWYLAQPNIAAAVDLQKVFGQHAPTDDIRSNPVVKQLYETVDGLTKQVQGFMGQQQSAQVTSVEQQITEFASAKGADGTPLRPHFEAVREDVFNLIPALKAQFPQATVGQIMEKAYQTAIHTNDSVSGEIRRIEEERLRSQFEKDQRIKAAQLANKSLPTGSPPGKPVAGAADPNDLRGTITGLVRSWKTGEQPRI